MFGQLGRLVWAPFTFLWSYVTLPTLMILLTIYFLNLYHSESLYYVSWNNSMVRPLPVGTRGLAPHPVSPTLRDQETQAHRPRSYPIPGTWGTVNSEHPD